MSRYTTTTIVTASVSATSFLEINEVIGSSFINIYKIKVVPSIVGVTSELQFYKKDTFVSADLLWGTNPFAATGFDPIQKDSAGVITEAEEGFVTPYEDLDGTGEIHLKIINNDSQAKTYTITIIWDDDTKIALGEHGQELHHKIAETELTALSGATVTASNLIPAGSLVLGVTARVTTLITGATTFDIGDGSTVDRWGNDIAVAANTTTDLTDMVGTSGAINPPIFTAANNIVLTGVGGSFTAGAVRLTVHYLTLIPAIS